MELIDRNSLITEIEKLLDESEYHEGYDCGFRDGVNYAVNEIKEKINTSEVKEVDLEKEIDNFLDSVEGVPRMWHSNEQIEWGKDIAKHFFELGLQIH